MNKIQEINEVGEELDNILGDFKDADEGYIDKTHMEAKNKFAFEDTKKMETFTKDELEENNGPAGMNQADIVKKIIGGKLDNLEFLKILGKENFNKFKEKIMEIFKKFSFNYLKIFRGKTFNRQI